MQRCILLISALGLAGCSPPKPVALDSAAKPALVVQSSADTLPEIGRFDARDAATGSWVVVSVTEAMSGSTPVSICHVSPAINDYIALVVLVEKSGAEQIGVARAPGGGASRPLGDVAVSVDGGAPHRIRQAPMNAAALMVWPVGAATLAEGPDADALLLEILNGGTVEMKESGGTATRSFPTEGLANAVAKCEKDLQ